ncbi:MAG: hypothetical protein A2Y38_22890 [Spirochaetes bacterium GWB1_59_5]|nr:MAG: hypothetical protein A2Y38_22890 [Spirochaetes bacterium GWB1_59_5]
MTTAADAQSLLFGLQRVDQKKISSPSRRMDTAASLAPAALSSLTGWASLSRSTGIGAKSRIRMSIPIRFATFAHRYEPKEA